MNYISHYRKHTITVVAKRQYGLDGHEWSIRADSGGLVAHGWLNDSRHVANLRAFERINELLGPIDVSVGDEDLALSAAVGALPRRAL